MVIVVVVGHVGHTINTRRADDRRRTGGIKAIDYVALVIGFSTPGALRAGADTSSAVVVLPFFSSNKPRAASSLYSCARAHEWQHRWRRKSGRGASTSLYLPLSFLRFQPEYDQDLQTKQQPT